MKAFLRYLVVVQYDYRDIARLARARMLLPLFSMMAGLTLIYSLALGADITVQTGLVVLWIVGWLVAALWLLQRGFLSAASAMIALLLCATAAGSLLSEGVSLRALLFLPFVMAYMGLAYGLPGTLLAILVTWIALPLVAYMQSEGLLGVEAASRDELLQDALVGSLNLSLMALLLAGLAWHLEQALFRASRIAIQTRATAEAGQAISRTLNMDELLTRSVDLIRDRFALYHVQVFMVDDARAYANLAASTGEIGQGLLAQGFQVPLNAHSIISDVISTRELIYAKNMSAYQQPRLLAETRSEIAVPLLLGEEAFGVLDIHSLRVDAFSNEDIETMRVMANQISQAVQNARLFEAQQRGLLQNRRLFLESETNLREIQRLNRQLTGQAWQDYVQERDPSLFSVQLNGQEMVLGAVDWTPAMRQATTRHRLVIQKHDNDYIFALPISIRGQPIGAIEVRLSGEQNQGEALSILQAVAERVAFSLENARLFEQSQAMVEREQQINMITARLQGLTSIEDVLTAAVGSLGQALHAEQGTIRLFGLEDTADKPALITSPNGDGQDHVL